MNLKYYTHLLSLILLFPLISSAQSTFQKAISGSPTDILYHGMQTTDGGFLNVGLMEPAAFYQYAYLVKTDSNGSKLWAKSYQGYAGDELHMVIENSNHNLVMCGTTTAAPNHRCFYLQKTDPNGTIQWSKGIGLNASSDQVFGEAVQQMSDGGYLVTGSATNPANLFKGLFIGKTDSSGNPIWGKRLGGTVSDDELTELIPTSDGGFLASGIYNYSNQIPLIKLDSQGNIQWKKVLEANGTTITHSIRQTNDGGYIICGSTVLSTHKVFLCKTDSSGNFQWVKAYGGTVNPDYGFDAIQTNDGGFIIAGYTLYFANTSLQDVYLLKTDADGTLAWSKTFGSTGMDIGKFVAQTSDGYFISGVTDQGTNDVDFFILKTDTGGNIGCSENYPATQTFIGTFQNILLSDTFTTLTLIDWPINITTDTGATETILCSSAISEPMLTDFSVYPNPANDKVNIEFPEEAGTIWIRLFNQLGQCVYKDSFTAGLRLSLDFGNVADGLYTIGIYKRESMLNNRILIARK